MIEMTTLNDGRRVLAKTDKKYGLCAKTFANRTQAAKAAKECSDFITHVTYTRPFYVVVRTWDEGFAECCEEFRLHLVKLSIDYNKPLCQVYLWWREYSDACHYGDQSPVLSEFEQWYKQKLEA